ncbi:MAG: roadblock/LC7 domain-containing protein [Promethearchaeota archaeon]|nr:MAG: roadblock/LC7 domain-containing protein [Candidatus Lokiarchaeota archaeon]
MSSLSQNIRDNMLHILKNEEENTDLENLAVLSRVGMKVASASSSELDADATSASSTALIDLGLRLSEATAHGALTEIILHNSSGYSILLAINDEYIVFGGLKNVYRIGYYLGYLRELTRKLNRLISGDEVTEMTLSLEASEKAKLNIPIDIDDEKPIIVPTAEQDKEALDGLLGFLDDWEKEGEESENVEILPENNIVSIPKTLGMEYKKATEPISSKQVISEKAEEQFKVYEDEIPPVPLDDYTPMEIEEDTTIQEPQIVQESLEIHDVEPIAKAQSSGKLPSLEELKPPDFETQFTDTATEYETEFVLDKESKTFESVLKDLGWDEEED